MKLGLINSAWAQAGRETAFGIRMTKEIGFDTIDIFADPLDIDVKERKLIKDECDRAGLPIVSVACVAVGLIDFNPSVQRFHVERVQGVPRPGLRVRGEERAARPGRVHLGAAGDPARGAVGDGRGQRAGRSASTPRTWAWRSRWSWSRSSCRCSTTWTAWCGSSTTWTTRR